MTQSIAIAVSLENLTDKANSLAAYMQGKGFKKAGKEVSSGHAIEVIAGLAGYRGADAFMAELKKPGQADDRGAAALTLLCGLVHYLTRNYGDDLWDGSTREFLDEAAALLGWEPFEWQLDDDEEGSEPATPVREHSVETAKALLLEKLGYSFTPDVDQPGLWVWRNGNEGCDSSFSSLDAALDDVWMTVAGEVMGARNMADSDWDALSLAKQMTLIEETLLSKDAAPVKDPYTERSFELGAMSRDGLLEVLDAGDYPAHVYDWQSADIRAVILEAEFPGSSDPVPTKSPMEQAIEALQQRWGDEHGWYGRDEWREDVAQGNTKLGYWEWVQHAIEGNGDEEEHCSECGKPLDEDGYDGKCGDCADKEEDKEELRNEARNLGIDLSDVEFWVTQHYGMEFMAGNAEQRETWLHSYRQHNGLTPPDSKQSNTAEVQRQVANEVFEAYDFGEFFTVGGHDGWEWSTGSTLWQKTVFLEDSRTPNEPTKRARFVVDVATKEATASFF